MRVPPPLAKTGGVAVSKTGGRKIVCLDPYGVSHTGSSPSRMVTAPVRQPALPISISVPVQVPTLVGPFGPRGGTEPALPNSFSFLSQGTTLDLVAFLHPAHFFVNCPFIKFPSNYHDLNPGSIPGSGRSLGEGNDKRSPTFRVEVRNVTWHP